MKGPQRLPEVRLLDRQGLSVAGLKGSKAMPHRQGLAQRRTDQGARILTAGDKFGVHHLALAHLRLGLDQGLGEHIQQPSQGVFEALRRYLAEVIGVMPLGRGIELAAAGLHKGHQPLLAGKTGAA
jgi:hypothetical protein